MFEKIMNFVKGLFVKEDGGINWRTVILGGAGAAAGGFGLLSGIGLEGITGVLAGLGLGVGASAVSNVILPSSSEPSPDARGAGGDDAAGDRTRSPAYEPTVPVTPMRATNTRER